MGVTSEPRDRATMASARAAAADAWATVSGMSLGPSRAPQTNTPGRVVSTGLKTPVLM